MRYLNGFRFLLFVLNFLSFLVFLSLVGGAIYFLLNLNEYFLSSSPHQPSYSTCLVVCLVLGSLLSLLTCLGWAGPASKSSCLLNTFIVMLLVTTLAVVGGLIYIHTESGYLNVRSATLDILNTAMEDNIEAYKKSKKDFTERVWRVIQTGHQCCGAHSYLDWSDLDGLWSCKTYQEGCAGKILNKLEKCWKYQDCDEKVLWVKFFFYGMPLPVMLLSLVLACLVSSSLSSEQSVVIEEADRDFQHFTYSDNPAYNPHYGAPPSYDQVVFGQR